MHDAVLSLGSNQGDRWQHLRDAVHSLRSTPRVHRVVCSSVYETAPVGGPPQGSFLNLALRVTTELSARELLEVAHRLEAAAGRERLERWGPRSLDVDVISYDDVVSDDPRLTLPHPRAGGRAFVLVPWLEIDPQAKLPGHGRVSDLVGLVDGTGVTRAAGAESVVGAES